MGIVGYIKDRYKEINLRLRYLAYGRRMPTAFQKVVLPIIRRVLPNVIATELLGVQPMSGPAGQVFALKTRYGIYGFLDSGGNIHFHWGRELRNQMDALKKVLLS